MTPQQAPPVQLEAPDGSRALVSPFGAHVTSWMTPDGREQLYLSSRAVLDGSAAIRGGIPVIFPQFAGEGPLPKHGFARTARWQRVWGGADHSGAEGATGVHARDDTAAAVTAMFELSDSPETRSVWRQAFLARVIVTLRPQSLDVRLLVTNTGSGILSFTAALHTYLSMDDAFRAEVAGLEGLSYRDSITRAPGTQAERVLAVSGAVNRVYSGAPARVEVRDGSRVMLVETAGFRDAVVWNPGAEGEEALGDMAPGDARRMLCVEPAVVERPVLLHPNERWEGAQQLVAH